MLEINKNMNKKIIIAIGIILLFGNKGNAQNKILQSKTDSIINDFFSFYSKSSKEAIKYIFSLPTDISEISKVDLEKKYLLQEKRFGNFYDYSELIKIQPSSDIQLISCLVKHEKVALRISFTFYKPNKEWKLYNFSFDTNIVSEMEEAEKIYYYEYNKR
jgi:hypothetical protein